MTINVNNTTRYQGSDASGSSSSSSSAAASANPYVTAAGLPVSNVFDVDPHTGFMSSQPPIPRLPEQWEQWEAMLDLARSSNLEVGDALGITDDQVQASAAWRARVREVCSSPPFSMWKSPICLSCIATRLRLFSMRFSDFS